MANGVRGEVPLGDTGVNLRFTTNAIVEFETASGQKFLSAVNSLGDEPSFSTMRLLVWAGARSDHPKLTQYEAGELMDDAGVKTAMEAVGQAILAAMPESKSAPEKH